MAISNSDGNYITRNTALAAYLRIEGFNLLDVKPASGSEPAVFIFESHKDLPNTEHTWQLGQLESCRFFESYRLCLKMVKVGKL